MTHNLNEYVKHNGAVYRVRGRSLFHTPKLYDLALGIGGIIDKATPMKMRVHEDEVEVA